MGQSSTFSANCDDVRWVRIYRGVYYSCTTGWYPVDLLTLHLTLATERYNLVYFCLYASITRQQASPPLSLLQTRWRRGLKNRIFSREASASTRYAICHSSVYILHHTTNNIRSRCPAAHNTRAHHSLVPCLAHRPRCDLSIGPKAVVSRIKLDLFFSDPTPRIPPARLTHAEKGCHYL